MSYNIPEKLSGKKIKIKDNVLNQIKQEKAQNVSCEIILKNFEDKEQIQMRLSDHDKLKKENENLKEQLKVYALVHQRLKNDFSACKNELSEIKPRYMKLASQINEIKSNHFQEIEFYKLRIIEQNQLIQEIKSQQQSPQPDAPLFP